MNLRQQVIQDHIEKTASLLKIQEDEAFLYFVYSLIVGKSIHAVDPGDIVDGGQDKQIDVLAIEQGEDRADVYILQVKNVQTFSSNALIQFRNGLNWVFNKTRKDLETLGNKSFRDRILEYRALQSGLGPSNIRITIGFITKGLTSDLSSECTQEIQTIKDQYDNDTFEDFRILVYGAEELVSVLNSQDRKNRRIDSDIKIKYDANNPSLIKYYSQDLQGMVCTVPASEVAKLVNEDPEGSIFDLNIRRFLGTRGSVNQDILSTCEKHESSYQFWFLNNGITVVCDKFDAVADPDNPHVKLKNMQIVNGCQTATTIALAQREGKLASDVRILMRIYETTDANLVNKIVRTTNNQNKISSRDLRANDEIQIVMEQAFKNRDYFYERKDRQFDDLHVDSNKILPNELVAQAYLSIVMRTPSDGRARKYKVWGELYNKIFSGAPVEPYLISVLITKYTNLWLRSNGYTVSNDEVIRKIAKIGYFHLARTVAYLWHRSDQWKVPAKTLRKELLSLEKDPSLLDKFLKRGLTLMKSLVYNNENFKTDIDQTFKSYLFDEKITERLHVKKYK